MTEKEKYALLVALIPVVLVIVFAWMLYSKYHPKQSGSSNNRNPSSEYSLKIWGGWILIFIVILGTIAIGIQHWKFSRTEIPWFLLFPASVPVFVYIFTNKHWSSVSKYLWVFGSLVFVSWLVHGHLQKKQHVEASVKKWSLLSTHSSAEIEALQMARGQTEIKSWKGQFTSLDRDSSLDSYKTRIDWGTDYLVLTIPLVNGENLSMTFQNVPGSLLAEGEWKWYDRRGMVSVTDGKEVRGKAVLNTRLPSADRYCAVSGTLLALPKDKDLVSTKRDLDFTFQPGDREKFFREIIRN